MCESTAEIKENDIVIQELLGYQDDYEVEKSSGHNGVNEFRLLSTRTMIAERVKSIQIKQDVTRLISLVEKHIENKDIHSPKGILLQGKVIAWGSAILCGSYLFFRVVETVCGLDKLLMALVP